MNADVLLFAEALISLRLGRFVMPPQHPGSAS